MDFVIFFRVHGMFNYVEKTVTTHFHVIHVLYACPAYQCMSMLYN